MRFFGFNFGTDRKDDEPEWQRLERRRQSMRVKEARTVAGGIPGIYTYKGDAGETRVGIKGAARDTDGSLITDKDAFRRTERFRNATRREKDRLSREFNKGVDLTGKEQSVILEKDPDGNIRQKDATYGFQGTADDRAVLFRKEMQVQDMQNKAAKKNEQLADMRKRQQEQQEENERQKNKEEKEDDSERATPKPDNDDESDEAYDIADSVAAESESADPFVRRSHVNMSIDEELMQLYSEIESLGGGV
jgi:hypothetical protein